MLRNLTDEHKFQLMSKLCQELLAEAAEGALDVREERASQLVADALQVLASKVVCAAPVRESAGRRARARVLTAEAHGGGAGAGNGAMQEIKLSSVKSVQEMEEDVDAATAGAAAGPGSAAAAAEAALANARNKVLSKVWPCTRCRALRQRWAQPTHAVAWGRRVLGTRLHGAR